MRGPVDAHQEIPAAVGKESSGYASLAYAQSLAEFGEVRELPACGGALLLRPIDGSDLRDGMGCYPLFSCPGFGHINIDLTELAQELVSICLVTDPFAAVTASQLGKAFPDICYPYKQHYVVDLSRPLELVLTSHHRRNVRKAQKLVEVRSEPVSPGLLSAWQDLYNLLVARHGISGIARFSETSFARQMNVPGFTSFSAFAEGQRCGINLWYISGNVAYYHLAAYSDHGYATGASFALFWNALRHFAKLGVSWAALGAGAGTTAAKSGLTRFKEGWSTEMRWAYFCGRILQQENYSRLSASRTSSFFPAYRGGFSKAAS